MQNISVSDFNTYSLSKDVSRMVVAPFEKTDTIPTKLLTLYSEIEDFNATKDLKIYSNRQYGHELVLIDAPFIAAQDDSRFMELLELTKESIDPDSKGNIYLGLYSYGNLRAAVTPDFVMTSDEASDQGVNLDAELAEYYDE